MIKVIYCIRRKAGMSREGFLEHWMKVHAPIVMRNREVLRLARYVQTLPISHRFGARVERPGVMLAPYDGVAELAWASLEDFHHAFESEAARMVQRELAEDEANFIDAAGSARWICDEVRQIEP